MRPSRKPGWISGSNPVACLLGLIRKRQLALSSISPVGIFALALVVDLAVCVAAARHSGQGVPGARLVYFEGLHYLIFFVYSLLITAEECVEIMRKSSLFPVSAQSRVLAIFLNTTARFPALVLVALGRIILWSSAQGSAIGKTVLVLGSLLALGFAGFLSAAFSLALVRSPRAIGVAAGLGAAAVVFLLLPFLG